jgi:hypothetical protein
MAVGELFNDFLNRIKEMWSNFDLKKISNDVGGTSAEAVQAAMYFGASFALGFLFKKYFKFLFSCLIISAILIKILEYNTLLTVNWNAIWLFLGVGPETGFNTIINQYFDWIKNNIVLFISAFIGFLIGYKLG